MGRIYSCFWCNATQILRRTIKCRSYQPFFRSAGLEARQPSAFGRGRVLCRLARALAELPRLLGQHLHLALDIVGLQSQHVLDVSRPHQLLGKFEGARDVSLGESHRLFGYILGTLAGSLGLPSNALTAWCAAEIKPSKACRAC